MSQVRALLIIDFGRDLKPAPPVEHDECAVSFHSYFSMIIFRVAVNPSSEFSRQK